MASSSGPLKVPENQWHTPFYAIWSDLSLNCMICFCPSCAYSDTVTRLDGRYGTWCPSCFAHTCASFILSCALVGADTRRQIRETFHLPQEPCNDYLMHCFCCWCALCQEAREIKYRSQLMTPSGLAAQLVGAPDAPEVQLMARTKSKVVSLKEWEWRPTNGPNSRGGSTAVPRNQPPGLEHRSRLQPNNSATAAGGSAAKVGPSRLQNASRPADVKQAGAGAEVGAPDTGHFGVVETEVMSGGVVTPELLESSPLEIYPALSLIMDGEVEIEPAVAAGVKSGDDALHPQPPPLQGGITTIPE